LKGDFERVFWAKDRPRPSFVRRTMRRKTSPSPIARASAVRPLVSETIVRGSRLPTAAALAAALFATGVASIGCGTSRADTQSVSADDHDRGRVLATNESTAHIGDGDKKPAVDTNTPPVPSSISVVTAGTVAPVTTATPPHPVPIPHGGKVAPITPHPLPPPPAGGPVAIPPKMPGGKSAVTTTGATTPPCANPGVSPTF
jgi:hypothetical protein